MVVDLGGRRPWQAPPGQPDSRLLYEQVVAYVEELVAERGLVPGDMLPTYAELAASTGVSLITVRRALDELEKAGRVRRHQGRGTFLARPRIITEPARAGSLLGTLRAGDTGPPADSIDTHVVEICRGLASAGVVSALRINPDEPVWRLRRQRLVDGQPAVGETSIIPVALAPRLDHQVSGLNESLYDLLAHDYGLEDDYEEQILEVIVTPGPDERKLLGIGVRTPVVRIRGVSIDKSGTPFDCFEHLYRATEFAFAISGSTSRQLFPAPAFQDWDVRAMPEGSVPRACPGQPPPAT
jgi:DNA-binding GntR family transcriptional regulator